VHCAGRDPDTGNRRGPDVDRQHRIIGVAHRTARASTRTLHGLPVAHSGSDEGERCIEGFRALAGATDPTAAAPGSIRGDLGRDWGLAVQQNIVHGSDSPESAEREIAIWFPGL
jgi:hypothetical protein